MYKLNWKNNFVRLSIYTLMSVLMVAFVATYVVAQEAPEGYIYEWGNSIEEAVEESDGKEVFVYFAGSDWCPHCMRFEEEVIDTPIFQRYLEKNFTPVLIDNPRHYELSVDQKIYNELQLFDYEVKGYPTIVIVNSDGETVDTIGYDREGANAFIKTLKDIVQ